MPKDVKEEELADGKLLENRSCTDCCCLVLFAIFVIGWIVVIVVAIMQGDPSHIILPTNFRGDTCGLGRLENYTLYFVPLPSHYYYGVCVTACPDVLEYVCNNDLEPMIGDNSVTVPNTYYNHTTAQYIYGALMSAKCPSCNTTEQAAADRYYALVSKAQDNKCFPVIYSSGSTLYRCIPFGEDRQNETLANQANQTLGDFADLVEQFGLGSFFSRGFSESQDAWLVVLICCGSAAVFAFLWVILLRWILAPIVYFCIVLVFALLIGLGYLSYRMAEDYANVVLPGDTASGNQLILWRTLQYAAWILAAMYVVVMLWLINRIRIAICIMKEASKAFTNNPGFILIPPVTFVFLLAFIALFVVTSLYIQTIGELTTEAVRDAAVAAFGAAAVNLTEAAASTSVDFYASLTNQSNTSFNATAFTTAEAIKALHAYNFFMFLWTGNFILCFGFFVMALVISTWYFSATALEMDKNDHGDEGGRGKATNAGTLCKAICVAIRYHLGTVLFGAFLIALIQFVRALFLYIERTYLQKYKDNATVKIVIWIVNCCLAYCERLVKIISKNAFIISCIKSTGFFSSAVEALGVLTANILRVAMLEYLSAVACFIIKCFIVGCNMILAYFLMQATALTNDVEIESGLFPLFFILILSFAIASLFINVYESCVDTILMCFFIDERDLQGAYMPPDLAKLVGMFKNVAEARQKYESALKEATTQSTKQSMEP